MIFSQYHLSSLGFVSSFNAIYSLTSPPDNLTSFTLSLKQASRPYQSRIHSSNSQTQRMCCELCYICTHYLPTRNHSPTEAVVNTSTWPELNTKVSQFRNWFEINPRLFTSKRYMPGKWHDYGNIFSPKAAVNTSTCQPGVLYNLELRWLKRANL